MSNGYKHLLLAWALIAAQLFVVVIGHGRIVICHDEGGSTHIELVGEDSCSVNDATSCGLGDELNNSSTQRLCAETSCEDELYGLTYTLAGSRRIGQRASADFAATNSFVLMSPLISTSPTVATNQAFGVFDSIALRECRLAHRATVLIL